MPGIQITHVFAQLHIGAPLPITMHRRLLQYMHKYTLQSAICKDFDAIAHLCMQSRTNKLSALACETLGCYAGCACDPRTRSRGTRQYFPAKSCIGTDEIDGIEWCNHGSWSALRQASPRFSFAGTRQFFHRPRRNFFQCYTFTVLGSFSSATLSALKFFCNKPQTPHRVLEACRLLASHVNEGRQPVECAVGSKLPLDE